MISVYYFEPSNFTGFKTLGEFAVSAQLLITYRLPCKRYGRSAKLKLNLVPI